MITLDNAFYNGVFTNLVSAIIGGVATAAASRTVLFIRNRRVASMYPVAGEYITYYQDVVGDKVVVMKSHSVLYQNGYKIWGRTTLKNGRCWILDGTLLDHGHIHGSYKPEEATDEGVGAFYLRLSEGDLNGIWAGYDSDNKKISHGEYKFRRMVNVNMVPFDKSSHRAALWDIARRVFGAGYFEKVAIEEPGPGKCFWVAECDGVTRGFVFGEILGRGEANELLKGNLRIAPRNIQLCDRLGKLGVLRSVAVDRRFQGRGVGRALILKAEHDLKEMGADAIVVLAWKAGERVNVASLVEYLGYDCCGEIGEYWIEDCNQAAFDCPERGDRCVCSVKMYCKTVSKAKLI